MRNRYRKAMAARDPEKELATFKDALAQRYNAAQRLLNWRGLMVCPRCRAPLRERGPNRKWRRCFECCRTFELVIERHRSVSHLLRALETFQALGVHFVSLSESLDTSTPAGKIVFTGLGAVAELERSLIVERVKAGLRKARPTGKRIGRPRVIVDARRIGALRASGSSWSKITRQTGWTTGTVQRAFYSQKACPSLPTIV